MYTWPRSEVLLSSRAGIICQSLIETLYIISRDRWCVESIIQNYFWIQWILLSNIIYFKKFCSRLTTSASIEILYGNFGPTMAPNCFVLNKKYSSGFQILSAKASAVTEGYSIKKTFHQITFLMRFISWIDFSLRL